MADVMMPRLGVSVTEGTVSTWLKYVGDTVEVGEPICEVATDKVDTEIESTVAGVLTEQRYAEGDVVLVGRAARRGECRQAAKSPPDGRPAHPVEPSAGRGRRPSLGGRSRPNRRPSPPPARPEGGLVLMPRLGCLVTEGTVSTWLKDVGDTGRGRVSRSARWRPTRSTPRSRAPSPASWPSSATPRARSSLSANRSRS